MGLSNLSSASRLSLAKTAVFVSSLVNVGWNRFSTNFFLSHGYTAAEVSQMKSATLLVKAVAQQAWASAADMRGHLPILQVHLILSALALELMRLIVEGGGGFRTVLFARCLKSAASAAASVNTAFVLDLVRGTEEGFGKQRLFGSLSWGLGSMVVGMIIDAFGIEAGIFGFTYAGSFFYLALLLYVSRLAVGEGFGAAGRAGEGAPKGAPGSPRPFAAKVWTALRPESGDLQCIALLANALFFGISWVLADTIVYIQLEKDFQASRTVTGAVNLVAILSSVPVYWYSKAIFSRIGHWALIILAQLFLIPRFLLHALVDASNYRWSMPLANSLHGAIFAAIVTSQVELLESVASVELCASMQSLLHCFTYVIGASIGNILWGGLYDVLGAANLYRIGIILTSANVALTCAILHLSVQRQIWRANKTRRQTRMHDIFRYRP